nr:MAG TPA: hypothetical protein [Caudoviricetes sp.]
MKVCVFLLGLLRSYENTSKNSGPSWAGRIRTCEMVESNSTAFPLGYNPIMR